MQYLLLGKRDKSFVEILAYSKLQDNNISKRNVSTKDLNLTFENLQKLENFYDKKLMNYELLIESSKSFGELQANLRAKGYKIIPQGSKAKLFVENQNFLKINELSKKKVVEFKIVVEHNESSE